MSEPEKAFRISVQGPGGDEQVITKPKKKESGEVIDEHIEIEMKDDNKDNNNNNNNNNNDNDNDKTQENNNENDIKSPQSVDYPQNNRLSATSYPNETQESPASSRKDTRPITPLQETHVKTNKFLCLCLLCVTLCVCQIQTNKNKKNKKKKKTFFRKQEQMQKTLSHLKAMDQQIRLIIQN